MRTNRRIKDTTSIMLPWIFLVFLPATLRVSYKSSRTGYLKFLETECTCNNLLKKHKEINKMNPGFSWSKATLVTSFSSSSVPQVELKQFKSDLNVIFSDTKTET
jgi:hypothetical protein